MSDCTCSTISSPLTCASGSLLPSSFGIVALLGIGLHSFIDGLVYSVTYSVSVFTGVLATTGMVLHEFPEGIITYLLLLRSGIRQRTALLLTVVEKTHAAQRATAV